MSEVKRLALIGLVGLVACTGTSIKTSDKDSPATAENPPTSAGIGDTITLRGSSESLLMEVTVVKVVDPAKAPKFFGPGRGKRYIAVQIRLTNIGSEVYNDSPSNGAVIIDTDDQQFLANIDIIEPGIGSPQIAAGESRLGFLTFELPERSKPRSFQFTLDSGFGPETGQWVFA